MKEREREKERESYHLTTDKTIQLAGRRKCLNCS